MLGVALVGPVMFSEVPLKCETSCAQPFLSGRAGYDGLSGTACSWYAAEILARRL
jgi:hypothetical protein